MQFENIDIEKLHHAFTGLQPDERIVDVRSPEEYAEGHVPGSVNIPYDLVTARAPELKKLKTVHLYCRSGSRAMYAATLLSQAGVSVTCVSQGGMPDWIQKGYKVER